MSPYKANDDPRDSSLETKVTFPKTWLHDSSDALSSSAMFLSGLILVTRNRYLSWPALLLSIGGVINQHPLRTKEKGPGAWSGVALCISALLVSYMPYVLLPVKAPSQ